MSFHELPGTNLRWIHLVAPTKADLRQLAAVHPWHPTTLEYLASPTLHPALEQFPDHLFFILHFPVIYKTDKPNYMAEVDFLMTHDTLITITYRHYRRLDRFFELCTKDERLLQQHLTGSSVVLLDGILRHLFQLLITDFDHIEETVLQIERGLRTPDDTALVEQIFNTRQDVLDFRRTLLTQEVVLGLLPSAIQRLFGAEAKRQVEDIVAAQAKVHQLVDNHRETLDALHDTHQSLLSSRISRIMAVLTIFSAVILPVNLMASVWGMNHAFMPLQDGPYDFFIVLSLMFLLGLSLLLIFRRIRWL